MPALVSPELYEAFVEFRREIAEDTKSRIRELMPGLRDDETNWSEHRVDEYHELFLEFLREGSLPTLRPKLDEFCQRITKGGFTLESYTRILVENSMRTNQFILEQGEGRSDELGILFVEIGSFESAFIDDFIAAQAAQIKKREKEVAKLHDDFFFHVPFPAVTGNEELIIEVFCNQVAAATLMPQMPFLANDVVAAREGPVIDWGDDEIAEIAKVFSVSREAVVRRLLTFGKTTQAFYQQKRAQYKAERDAQKRKVRDESKGKSFRPNRAQRALSNFGSIYVGLVLSSYSDDRITLADAAKFLEVRAPTVRKVEELVRG